MQLTHHWKRSIVSAVLLLVLAACATSVTTRHPDFGLDCQEYDANVDCVRVFYGTNRTITVDGKSQQPSSEQDVTAIVNESGGELVVGRADIWLPLLVKDGGEREISETPLATGTPPTERDEQEKFVFITRITASGKEHFVSELQSAVDDQDSQSVMLFVHGFNVTFDAALIRSAQLVVDLREGADFNPGAPALFSWPSAGKVAPGTYRGDQARSLAAAPYLTEFLNLLTQNLEIERVNIIAHSMGNRVLTEALENYAATYLETHPDKAIEFRIVLAAADVDRAEFDRVAEGLKDMDPKVTIYASDNDQALNVSKFLNRFKPRLGDTDGNKPYIRNDRGFVTVDATPVATELFGLGHSYYSDNPFILNDIKCSLADTPPGDRALAERQYADEPNGERFFRTDPEVEAELRACDLRRQTRLGEDVTDRTIGVGEVYTGSSSGSGRGLGAATPPAPATMPPPPPPPPPPPVVAPSLPVEEEVIVQAMEGGPENCAALGLSFEVYFGWNEAGLSAQAAAVIEQVVMQIDAPDCLAETVVIAGHTDTSGEVEYNQALSARRAEAVAQALVDLGISRNVIQTAGYGEYALATQTPDGVREPLNRRSVITISVR